MAKKAAPSRETFISRSRGVSPEEKALYHNVAGAGKGHVVRKFFGLSKEDEDALTKALADRIWKRLRTT